MWTRFLAMFCEVYSGAGGARTRDQRITDRHFVLNLIVIVCPFTRSSVEMATYGLICESLNLLNTMTLQLAKLNDDGSCIGELVGSQQLHYVPDDFEVTEAPHAIDSPYVELPARQRDQRVFSTSKRRFFPFSPRGCQRV